MSIHSFVLTIQLIRTRGHPADHRAQRPADPGQAREVARDWEAARERDESLAAVAQQLAGSPPEADGRPRLLQEDRGAIAQLREEGVRIQLVVRECRRGPHRPGALQFARRDPRFVRSDFAKRKNGYYYIKLENCVEQ